MGLGDWFDTEYKITVYSAALLLTDKDRNPVKDTILAGIVNDVSVIDSLKIALYHGMSQHMDRVMTYARNEYTLGLPKGTAYLTSVVDETDAAAAITDALSLTYGCTVDWAVETPLHAGHIALPYLEKKYGYNLINNQLDTVPSWMTKPVPSRPAGVWSKTEAHDTSYVVTVTGVTHTTYSNPLPNEPTGYLTVAYTIVATSSWSKAVYDVDGMYSHSTTVQSTATDDTQTENFDVYTGAEGFRLNTPHVIVRYWENDAQSAPTGETSYWFYQQGTDIYPALEKNPTADNNELFPVIPLRYQKIDLTDAAHESTDLYKTSKKLLKKAGVDMLEVAAEINGNPDIGQIDHAYIMWGVNLQSVGDAGIKYLIKFFDHIYDTALLTQSNITTELLDGTERNENIYRFGDWIAPSGQSQQWTSEEVDGNLRYYKITVTNSTESISLEEHGLDIDITFKYITSTVVPGSIGAVGTVTMSIEDGNTDSIFPRTSQPQNKDILTLRQQISTGAYKEVVVVGLRHTNHVYQDRSIITSPIDVRDHADNNNFLIPLQYGVVQELPIRDRLQLYQETMHCVINCISIQEIEWYESGIFKAFAVIVSAFIGVFFQQWWLLKIAISTMVVDVLIAINPDLALALKVVMAVYLVVTFNYGGLMDLAKLSVETLMEAVTMAGTVIEAGLSVRMRQLQGEMEDLAVEYEAKMKELDELWDDLDTEKSLDPGLLLNLRPEMQPTMLPPETYYNLKLQTNPGIITLELPHGFCHQALQLPDFSFKNM